MPLPEVKDEKVIAALKAAWEREIEAAQLYRVLAEQTPDERRARILIKLAEAEEGHAQQFAARIGALGGIPPKEDTSPTSAQRLMARTLGGDAMLRRLEAEEERNATLFEKHALALQADAESHALFNRIEDEERQHAVTLHSLKAHEEPRTRLEAMLKGEKWHVSTGSWIGDAIYGVNDGLGAVFGVVSGMAGAAGTTNAGDLHGDAIVRVSGMVAMLASALSMGASAFMASKSEREVYEAEIAREKAEIEQSPEHEKEELELLYQLKGFAPEEAAMMANRIASQPDQFLKTMAQEELGLSDRHFANPVTGAVSAALATAVGGIVPILPFFFMRGMTAVIAAAIVGMAAHFLVGAAKSVITARSWWASGLEMTVIGIITGGVTYGLGRLFHIG
jgi:VIT1/CCC1 family predicted Fe2+/Mn2+ transporter/rubrerythrin